jgi:alpha-galactosidase
VRSESAAGGPLQAAIRSGTLAIRDHAAGQTLLEGHGEALLGDGTLLNTIEHPDRLSWRVDAGAADGLVIRLILRNLESAAVGVEQLRPLVAPRGYAGLRSSQLRIHQMGWQSWSRSHPPAPFEANAATAAPPIRGPYLPHRHPDSQLEAWMTILVPEDAPADAPRALLLGFIGAEHQLGTLEIVPVGADHLLIAATELDGTSVGSRAELASEPLLIALGSQTDLLDAYARAVAQQMHARPTRTVLTGWCSWYQLYTQVTAADVQRTIASLAAHRDLLPLRLIQLDDGYERAIGDWLEVLPSFPSGMPSLVRDIRQHGALPGVWLAPFLLSARSHTYAQHPDWVVRDERGQPLNAIDNWGSANFALDTSHPAALAWLEQVVRTVCDDWGFEYLKLDFLYAAAMRGQRYDSRITGVEAYRRGMLALRRIAGERFILGCGAPLVASVGIVDGMRIGSDVAAAWGREGNADGPSLRNATRATLARMWMHGHWWANDPDCVVVRADDTQLSLDEVQGWASVVALSGGMLFVGDDVSRVDESRLRLLARLLPPSDQAASTGGPLVGLMPERLWLRVERAWGTWAVVGIANWSDSATTVRFDPAEFALPRADGYHLVDLWTGDYLGLHAAALDLGPLAPHGIRLLSVHPDLGRPQTIGSSGHLLGDVMDLAREQWDAATRVLTLTPAAGGPPGRLADLIVFDPHGPLRRVPVSAADQRPIRLEFPTA